MGEQDMAALRLVKSVSGLFMTSTLLVMGLFWNLTRKPSAQGPRYLAIWGIEFPAESTHYFFGPLLLLFNGITLFLLLSLYYTQLVDGELAEIQKYEVYWIMGFLVNPFHVSRFYALHCIGLGFLIILWWTGFHSLRHSLSLAEQAPMLTAWGQIVQALFLVLGLAAMVLIQWCWRKFGQETYTAKTVGAWVGIPLGAFIVPLCIGAGIPEFIMRLWRR